MTLYRKKSTVYEANQRSDIGASIVWEMVPRSVNGTGIEHITADELARDWEPVPSVVGAPADAGAKELEAEHKRDADLAAWGGGAPHDPEQWGDRDRANTQDDAPAVDGAKAERAAVVAHMMAHAEAIKSSTLVNMALDIMAAAHRKGGKT